MVNGTRHTIHIYTLLHTIHTGLASQPIYTPFYLHLLVDIRLKAVEYLETADHLNQRSRGSGSGSGGLSKRTTRNAGAGVTGSFKPGPGLLDIALQVILSTNIS
jgi:hypothetical protein